MDAGIYLSAAGALAAEARLDVVANNIANVETPGFKRSFTLVRERPPEAAAFWREAYPSMGTIASNSEVARGAGYDVLDTFVLPASAWWDEYYRPIQARIESLRERARDDADLTAAIAETEREIALYARHGSSYGYVFYLLRVR